MDNTSIDAMEVYVYEVLCDGVDEARTFRFKAISDAMHEAERVCNKYHVPVRVVRVIGVPVRVVHVIGTYVPESRWVKNNNEQHE